MKKRLLSIFLAASLVAYAQQNSSEVQDKNAPIASSKVSKCAKANKGEEQPCKSEAPLPCKVEEKCLCPTPLDRFFVEAKAGYFLFSSEMMKNIYNRGGIDVQLSFTCLVWKYLQVYGSVEYLHRSGKSAPLGSPTTFTAIPFSLGLRAIWHVTPRWPVDFYLTAGPRYFLAYVFNDSSFVPRHMHAYCLGGFANTGFLFHLTSYLTLDLFAEYSYRRTKFHSSDDDSAPIVSVSTQQIGGYTFGGGLGYSF